MLDPVTSQGTNRSLCYEFADFRLHTATSELRRHGEPVALVRKSFEVLLVLVQHSGVLLEKSKLMDSVWEDVAVEENSLARAIADIRRALGEGPRDRRFIATIPGRGYRFLPDVKTTSLDPGLPHATWSEGLTAPLHATASATLAVLPFTWLTGQSKDEALSLGITDALITRLSNLKQLIVRPTSAVLAYAGSQPDLSTAAIELQVDYVISGLIQQVGDYVRVTVQLVSPDQQRSVWADQFDEKFTHLFAVEDSASERIATALALKLTNSQKQMLTRSQTENNEAYQLNLRGRYFFSRRTLVAAQKAIQHFQRAIELDPHFALPWVGIADAKILMGLHGSLTGWLPPHETYPDAESAALKALSLQPDLAEAHASLAFVRFYYRWDWPSAQQQIQHALLLQPHNGNAYHWYAMMCSFVGQHENALVAIRTALALEPLSLIMNANHGYLLYFARRYQDAIEQLLKTLEMDESFPATHHRLAVSYSVLGLHDQAIDHCLAAARFSADSPQALGTLAYAYARAGQTGKAEVIFQRLEQEAKSNYVSAIVMAEVSLGLNEFEQTLDWLDAALTERTSGMLRLRVDPRFDDLRSNPRFQSLLEQTPR